MSQEPRPARRPYTSPTLVTYGEAVELTQGNKATGAKQDGGGKSKMRTG
jgi:hypothetical protein